MGFVLLLILATVISVVYDVTTYERRLKNYEQRLKKRSG